MKFVDLAIAVVGPSTQELKECIKKIDTDDIITFAYPTHMTELSHTVNNLENNETVEKDVVSAEVPKLSLPMILSSLTVFINLSLSRSWFPKCLEVRKMYLLNKLANKKIIN